jgi:hypothetical protein
VIFYEDSFPLRASPNLTNLDFLCESGSLVSTTGTSVSLAGSSITPACQPAPVVPPGFEPQAAPTLMPLPAPRVPLGFPPRASFFMQKISQSIMVNSAKGLISSILVCLGCSIFLADETFVANLVVIPLESFDVILSMDWLSQY